MENARRTLVDLYYVAVNSENKVLGYCYANEYRPRPAYRFAVENSVYIHPDYVGRGIGSTLMKQLIRVCTEMGFRQMLAFCTANRPDTIAMHTKLGFKQTGIVENVGWKFDQWLSVAILQRSLGEGASSAPSPARTLATQTL